MVRGQLDRAPAAYFFQAAHRSLLLMFTWVFAIKKVYKKYKITIRVKIAEPNCRRDGKKGG
jgi:hypothetical protein